MTDAEARHFDQRLTEMHKSIKAIAVEVGTIKRGVYGDPDNKVSGLIDTDREQHKRIKSLEESRKKALFFGGGLVAAFEGLWHWLKA